MLSDHIRFLRKLNLRKICNAIAVRASCWLSNWSGRPLVWGNPWFVSIETAAVCNLSCPQCPAGRGEINRNRKFLERDQYLALLEQLARTTLMLSLYFQGEPLVQQDFPEWVRLASERGIYTQTSTNGQLLDDEMSARLVESGLDRLIIGMDGSDEESYQSYRKGGSLAKVLGGLQAISGQRRDAGKKHPLIIVQILVFRHNEHQVQEMRDLAFRHGADRVWIKKAQVEYPGEAVDLLPGNPAYSRYWQDGQGRLRPRARLRNRCNRLWQTTVITSDSLVVPCCFDKKAAHPLGRFGDENSFRQIWTGPDYKAFRQQVLRSRTETGICTNCTEGMGKVYRSIRS